MSILSLQRRLHERGRIRIGYKVPTAKGGERPAKLDRFRFTSSDRPALDQAALLWGGTVVDWTSPAGPQFELISEVTDIPVVVPPSDFGFSQFMESWTGGGCQRRCDSTTELLSGEGCLCAAQDKVICKPTSRLSVMLPDLAGMGLWRLETHGWNAAAELAGTMELIQRALGGGRILPARLRLQQRMSIVADPRTGDPQTVNFVVPVLDIDVRLDELTAGTGAPKAIDYVTGEIGPGPEPRFTPVPVAELPEAPTESIAAQVAGVQNPPPRSPRANAQQPIPATGLAPRTAEEARMSAEGGGGEASGSAAPSSADTGEGDPNDWVPAMVARINKIADPKMRAGAMRGFKAAFGDPPVVGPDQAQDAVAVIAFYEAPPGPDDGGGGGAAPATPEDLDPGRPFDDEPSDTPTETPVEQHARLQRGLMAQATKTFPLEKEAGFPPKLQRTRQTAKRHAVTYVALNGQQRSANDMTVDQLLRVTAWLRDVQEGRLQVVEADDGWAVRLGDREILVTADQLAAA